MPIKQAPVRFVPKLGDYVTHAKHGTGRILLVPTVPFSMYWVERSSAKNPTSNGFLAPAMELKTGAPPAKRLVRTRIK